MPCKASNLSLVESFRVDINSVSKYPETQISIMLHLCLLSWKPELALRGMSFSKRYFIHFPSPCITLLIFEKLKHHCVQLSQLALQDDGSPNISKSLIQSTSQLLTVLEQKCRRTDGVFDEKLADYVFFPLSQVLRNKQKYTDRLSELTIKCLKILLEYGWRKSVALDLAKQLLILLTFVAGGVPGQDSSPPPEELAVEAYGSLAALFRDLESTPGGSTTLVEAGTIPALGHCVTVILDGITDGPSSEVQIEALGALNSVWRCIKDPQALSTLLPGTVSALTKTLMPGTATRRTRKTITNSLEVLELVLVSILSDIRTRAIKDSGDPSGEISPGETEQKTLTKSWLKATTSQIKLALSNVIRLRSHESVDVRKTLNRLCLTILDECHDTLSESASMLVETCMTLTGVEVEDGTFNTRTSLIDLASLFPDVADLIKSTIYNWVTSLPRVMQSNDETAKHNALGQLSKAHELLVGLNLESLILEDALSNSLRDSVTVTLESLPSPKALQEAEFDLNSQAALILTSENAFPTLFRPIILAEESQKKTRDQLATLLANLGTRKSQINMAIEMLEYVRGASGPGLVSAYWLSVQILRSAAASNEDLDEFFESSLTWSDEQEAVNQELFSHSQSILSGSDEKTSDWRLQAIALEVVADTAQRMKEGFRAELVDTLYPVVQLLGSPNFKLREHTITCLNIVSKACGYANTAGLIVDNVDYMVNAISLRLNTFDISPQAPQVLVMMIRLTGPSLLPYLDDVVGSIFAALDNFHGYYHLVEVLFSVLGELVQVGSKSGQLQLTEGPAVDHRKTRPALPAIEDIVQMIRQQQKEEPESDPLKHKDFPRKPWKDAKTLLEEANAPAEEQEDIVEVGAQEVQRVPPTKVYIMVQSIARLGQHYLTNQSPILRAKILGLISTACTALHYNEDEFLPLVNDIWPVVIKRLYDEEPFVDIAAADTVAEICRCAGDFMTTRIQVEWMGLMKMARQAKMKMLAEKKGVGSRGIYSQVNQVWESVVRLFITIVEYVRIDDDMFDEVLDLLMDLVSTRKDVRDALLAVNADSVWLVMELAGRNRQIQTPMLDGYHFAALDTLVSL